MKNNPINQSPVVHAANGVGYAQKYSGFDSNGNPKYRAGALAYNGTKIVGSISSQVNGKKLYKVKDGYENIPLAMSYVLQEDVNFGYSNAGGDDVPETPPATAIIGKKQFTTQQKVILGAIAITLVFGLFVIIKTS